jgi:hypothetical protein
MSSINTHTSLHTREMPVTEKRDLLELSNADAIGKLKHFKAARKLQHFLVAFALCNLTVTAYVLSFPRVSPVYCFCWFVFDFVFVSYRIAFFLFLFDFVFVSYRIAFFLVFV